MAFPRPLALGLIQLPIRGSREARIRARIELALDVNDHGYALVETFELGAGREQDEATFAELADVVLDLDIQLVALSGSVDDCRLRSLAERRRIVLWSVDHQPRVWVPR